MRSGFTLTEMVAALAIAAIAAAIAVPRMLGVADAASVRDETIRMVTALDAARGAAIRLGDAASLSIGPASYRAVIVSPTDTTVAWTQPGPGTNGVTIGGAGSPITFGPSGLATGVANRTITLSKGSALRKVVLSRLGRLTY